MKELWQIFFDVQVDQAFLKVCIKNLVKVARDQGEEGNQLFPGKFFSSFAIKIELPKYIVLIMQAINTITYSFKHGRD